MKHLLWVRKYLKTHETPSPLSSQNPTLISLAEDCWFARVETSSLQKAVIPASARLLRRAASAAHFGFWQCVQRPRNGLGEWEVAAHLELAGGSSVHLAHPGESTAGG